MKQSKRKAFTIIELVAVLVIMAIIALIVTPLVMSIIRKARISADKRSIDAYGRSIELAIAGYLMDNGSFPNSIEQLTIEYSGSEVVCETIQLNLDSSVYLAGCRVAGRNVDYSYGEDKTPPAPTYTSYSVGDYVSYNGVTYYVIEDSDTTNDTVKLLKEKPLTKVEMDNLSLIGINIEEINVYGGVQYGSSIDYSTSTVKQVVDAWKNVAVKSGDIATVRLITMDELVDNLGYEYQQVNPSQEKYAPTEYTLIWVYNSYYTYWTKTSDDHCSYSVGYESMDCHPTNYPFNVVRPVLELNKSADITKLN